MLRRVLLAALVCLSVWATERIAKPSFPEMSAASSTAAVRLF